MNDVNTRKRLDFSFSELRYNIIQIQKNSPKIEQDGRRRSSKQPEFTFCDVFVAFAVVDSKAPSWQRLRQRERQKTPGLIFS